MHGNVEIGLAFILFLPTFCIVGALYCLFPQQPRSPRRLFADLSVLLLAAVLSIVAMRWGFLAALGVAGPLWKQIVATLLAYGAFVGVLCIALPIRKMWLRRVLRESCFSREPIVATLVRG